ncbi:hypothetical protein TNIN_465341 [Trichonephila inaurata madagascariensis]|uniref:Uncharacterized protein n=1 Tax=Trichonephila inaurata madagascariensis TaxID=2747483 RepID=A0A8X7C086_9ARAC|nr:hypothetical protein TNIN_465341 [Trichonephila inaurata madagascariensis]
MTSHLPRLSDVLVSIRSAQLHKFRFTQEPLLRNHPNQTAWLRKLLESLFVCAKTKGHDTISDDKPSGILAHSPEG